MKPLSATDLERALSAQFPPDATSWRQATDEVRDMCRGARKLAGVSSGDTVDFCALATPAQWNTEGIAGIMKFYNMLNDLQQQQFCNDFVSFFPIPRLAGRLST